MITSLDIAKAAGLLEGEGCFSLMSEYPRISLSMTDEDVVKWFAGKAGTGVCKRISKRPKEKDQWTTHLYGVRAVGWMMTFYSFLHSRRRKKIREIISMWKARPVAGGRIAGTWTRAGFQMQRFSVCHPARKIYCRGFCHSCYNGWWKKTYPEKYRIQVEKRNAKKRVLV